MGALTALPVLLLALIAVPGSLLVARVGARRALVVGLLTVGVAGGLRGLGPSPAILFLMATLMACGIAVSQPSLPALVKEWLPDRIGLATGAFTNGMLVGEIIPVAISASLLLGLLGGSWGLVLAFWSLPVILTALLVEAGPPALATEPGTRLVRWWPDWRDPRIWLLGLILGGASAAYWSANAFLPDFLRHHHHADLITPALTSLNLVQLPASLLLALAGPSLVARRAPLVCAGLLVLLTTSGLAVLPPIGVVFDAGLLGFSTAFVFVLTLALPPVLAAPGDAHRLSAGVFTISYICPFVGSLIGGGLWDATHVAQTAFVPLFAGGVLIAILPTWLRLMGQHPAAPAIPAAVPEVAIDPNS